MPRQGQITTPAGYPPAPPVDGYRPPAMPMADYDQRRQNAHVEQMADENNVRFRNGVNQFRQQIASTRSDIEARRARGEAVNDPYAGINEPMLQGITREYVQSTERLKNQVKALYARSPNGVPPDPRWLQNQVDLLNQEHTLAFQRKIRSQYGEAGDRALQGIQGHTEDKGMVGRLTERMGTPGGLIGAAALGIMTFMGMGGMNGGILAIGASIIAAIAGAFMGGTVNDWISKSGPSPTPGTPDINTQASAQQPQREQAPPAPGNLSPGASPPTPRPPRSIT